MSEATFTDVHNRDFSPSLDVSAPLLQIFNEDMSWHERVWFHELQDGAGDLEAAPTRGAHGTFVAETIALQKSLHFPINTGLSACLCH